MRTKNALYNLITNLLLQMVVIVYGFIIPKIIIKNYGSDVNGLISSITQFLSYISLIEAGFGGVVQFLLYKPIAKKENKKINDILAASQKFFSIVSFIFIIYIIILCFIYPRIINAAFNRWFTVSLILIISINIFSEYYLGLVYKIYLLSTQQKYIISLISILTYFLNIVILVILSKFKVSIQLLKLVSTLLFTIRPILQNIYVRKKYNINIKEGNKNYKIEQKWDALAQHIATVIHGSTDITILTIFCNLAEVSVYSVYYMVVSGIQKIVSMFYDSISSGLGDLIAREEKEKLNKIFNMTESIYFTLIGILFSCTLLLIVPFVSVYTKNINDANYIRPLFGYLIVISELVWAVRLPYSSVSVAAGHYKETRNGAVVECIVNIFVSIIFVKEFGIIGVAIGTVTAMFIRTCEFIYHSNIFVLNRKIIIVIKKIIIMVLEILLIILLWSLIPIRNASSYLSWFINAIIMFGITFGVIVGINAIVYTNDFKEMLNIFKSIINKRKKNI